jgi:hypothetical protein
VIIASFVIVRVGAIAFQLTGLEWSLAKFQALSCFSGTGFTTKESELITGHPQRRKIASFLIVFGNAGLVTLIATAASALNPRNTLLEKLSKSYFPFPIAPEAVKWINLIIIVIAIYIMYKIFTHEIIAKKITKYLKKKIIKKAIFKPLKFEELVLVSEGYSVIRVKVSANSPVLNKTLGESELRKHDITVLAIARGDQIIANPSANMKIEKDDELISFGKMENIHGKI